MYWAYKSYLFFVNKVWPFSVKMPFWVRAHFGQSNFVFFQQKRKKEILLIVIIFTYFKVQKKIEKKNGQENWSFFHFSNFEVRFKNTKNTVNG